MSKVKKKKKLKHPKKVYIIRRIFVLAILLIIISLMGLFGRMIFNEIKSLRKIYNVRVKNEKIEELKLNLNIKEKSYEWAEALVFLNIPEKIIIHHAAIKSVDADTIHRMHQEKGWSGIGYHYFIDKSGNIYEGRPEGAIGAHAYKNNQNTLGICLEGNFEEELIGDEQYKALIELLKYLVLKYPINNIEGHNDVSDTLCPGKNINKNKIKEDLINELRKINLPD